MADNGTEASHHRAKSDHRARQDEELNTVPEEEEDDGRSGDANHRARLVRQEHVQIGDDSWAPDVEASAKPLGNGRRASYEHQRPRAGRELRRCRSEVSAPSDALPVEQPALAHQSNPLAAKDKIQAFARTARELRTLKLHYYPESGWGWVILFCACVTHCLCYGLLLAAGTLAPHAVRRYGWSPTSPAATSGHHLLAKPLPSDARPSPGATHYRSLYAPSSSSAAATAAAGQRSLVSRALDYFYWRDFLDC